MCIIKIDVPLDFSIVSNGLSFLIHNINSFLFIEIVHWLSIFYQNYIIEYDAKLTQSVLYSTIL